jgi:hypothetical protein
LLADEDEGRAVDLLDRTGVVPADHGTDRAIELLAVVPPRSLHERVDQLRRRRQRRATEHQRRQSLDQEVGDAVATIAPSQEAVLEPVEPRFLAGPRVEQHERADSFGGPERHAQGGHATQRQPDDGRPLDLLRVEDGEPIVDEVVESETLRGRRLVVTAELDVEDAVGLGEPRRDLVPHPTTTEQAVAENQRRALPRYVVRDGRTVSFESWHGSFSSSEVSTRLERSRCRP